MSNLKSKVLTFLGGMGAMIVLLVLMSVSKSPSENDGLTEEVSVTVEKTSSQLQDNSNSTNEVKKGTLTLSKDRVITLFGQVTGSTTDSDVTIAGPAVANKIRELDNGRDPIYLLINSPGGSVIGGAQVLSAMEESKSKVHTICIQLCASMAFIIHQYGDVRYMTDRAIIMSHQASMGTAGEMEQIKSILNFILPYIEKIDRPIAKKAGLSLEEYKKLIDNELWMDSDVATLKKFNDRVVKLQSESGSVFESSPRGNGSFMWLAPPRDKDAEEGHTAETGTDKTLPFDVQFILDPKRLQN